METWKPSKILIFGLITSNGESHAGPHLPSQGHGQHILLLGTVGQEGDAIVGCLLPSQHQVHVDPGLTHVSKKSMNFLNSNFHVVIQLKEWPSNSPDLNPCDYKLWSELRRKVNKKPPNSLGSLKWSVRGNMAKFTMAKLVNACSAFIRQVDEVVRAEGGGVILNENMLFSISPIYPVNKTPPELVA